MFITTHSVRCVVGMWSQSGLVLTHAYLVVMETTYASDWSVELRRLSPFWCALADESPILSFSLLTRYVDIYEAIVCISC